MIGVRIILVQAQRAPLESGLRQEKWYLPLGLLSIATVLRGAGFDDVHVFDLEHDSISDVEIALGDARSCLLGVNFNIFSVDLLDAVLRLGRARGAITVVGGQAATPIPERLLFANDNIDAVVVYDGERPMTEIAKRVASGCKDFSDIPNVVTRPRSVGSHEYSVSPKASRAFSTLAPDVVDYPIVDRGLVNFSRYVDGWNRPEIDSNRRPTSAWFQKGCAKTCTFCARIDKRLRQRDSMQIAQELRQLDELGVNYVYIVDDTFAADELFLRRLVAAVDISPIQFWCFADIRDLDEERVDLLARLRVEKVLIGIESGSEDLRRRNGKLFSNDTLFRRLDLLARAEIKVEDSYVIGLAGETQESLWETFLVARKVASICETEGTAFNIMTPLMGSPDWNRMMNVPTLRRKYATDYRFDVNEVREDFFREFCGLLLQSRELAGLVYEG